MRKLITALSLLTVLLSSASSVMAQQQRTGATVGASPGYARPFYGGLGQPVYGGPVYGAPVYGGYGGPVYGTPGYGGYGYQPYGSSTWRPTLGSPYANNYYPAGGVYGAPAYYAPPTAVSGNFFRFGNFSAATNVTYWRSPSGYYYPWGANWAAGSPVIIVQQGQSQPTKPPISTVLNDMERYVTEAKDKGQVSEKDYAGIQQRISDLRRKFSSMLTANDGDLDAQDDEYFRRDLDTLSRDISYRVKI